MRLRSIPLWLLMAGCAEVDMPFDGDADGLMDDDEADLGTDPTDDDSDDDGWTDGDEVDNYVDPTNAADHPYTGGWPIDSCRADMAGEETGTAEGDVAPGWELTDQFGETVRLHDFCGKVVLLVSAAFW